MKVKELIEKLNKLDPNLEIYAYSEDESLASEDHPYQVFSIYFVDSAFVTRSRDKLGKPVFSFESPEISGVEQIGFINITNDF